jgi:hypothetical protein
MIFTSGNSHYFFATQESASEARDAVDEFDDPYARDKEVAEVEQVVSLSSRMEL